MMRISLGAGLFLLGAVLLTSFVSANPQIHDRVSVTVNEEQRHVDISIDGQPFTSYLWPERLAKPVLYPLRTAKGTVITRGYPLQSRPCQAAVPSPQVGL